MNKVLIEHLKKEIASGDFRRAWDANNTLAEYDLVRAKDEVERHNARKEWEFRFNLWFSKGYTGKPSWSKR